MSETINLLKLPHDNPAAIPDIFTSPAGITNEIQPFVEPTEASSEPEEEAIPKKPSILATVEAITQLDGTIPDDMIAVLKAHDKEVFGHIEEFESTNHTVRDHVMTMKSDAEVKMGTNIANAQELYNNWVAQLERNRDAVIAEITARTARSIDMESLRLSLSVRQATDLIDATHSLSDSTEVAATENSRVINRLKTLREQHVQRRDGIIATINALNARLGELPGVISETEKDFELWKNNLEKCEALEVEILYELNSLQIDERTIRTTLMKDELESIEVTYVEGGILPVSAKDQATRNILAKATSPELSNMMHDIDLLEARRKHNKRSIAETEKLVDALELEVNTRKLEQQEIPSRIADAKKSLKDELATPFSELEAHDSKLAEITNTFYGIVSGEMKTSDDAPLPRSMRTVWSDMETLRAKAAGIDTYETDSLAVPKFGDIDLSFLSEPLEDDGPLDEILDSRQNAKNVSEQVDSIRKATKVKIVEIAQNAIYNRIEAIRDAAISRHQAGVLQEN